MSADQSIKPITLFIAKNTVNNTTLVHQSPIIYSNIEIKANPISQTIPIINKYNSLPTFNHTIIYPQVNNSVISNISDEREAHRNQLEKERQKRHNDKLKPYKKLAALTTLEERLASLIIMTYPELDTVPKYLFFHDISCMIKDIKAKYNK